MNDETQRRPPKMTKFPSRVWYESDDGDPKFLGTKWISRSVTDADMVRRKALLRAWGWYEM